MYKNRLDRENHLAGDTLKNQLKKTFSFLDFKEIDKQVEDDASHETGQSRVKRGFRGLPALRQLDLDKLNFAHIECFDKPKTKVHGLSREIVTQRYD